MSYHIVNIDTPKCELTVSRGQLVFKTLEATRQLPLEDIAAIVITSYSANIHSHLFLEAARCGVALIICDSFKPVSIVLPANRSSDTLLTKAALSIDKKKVAGLWRKTIDAKCQNQHTVAAWMLSNHAKLERLKSCAYGKSAHKEATSARYYWQILGERIQDTDFRRNSDGGGFNDLINYGYAILLSIVLQKLFAVGLDPTMGISHAIRERSSPLAYDLMEPFRPAVDRRVVQWLDDEAGYHNYEITREFRRYVTGFIAERVGYFKLEIEIGACVESVVRGFRKAVLQKQITHYKPWTAGTTKWDGCS